MQPGPPSHAPQGPDYNSPTPGVNVAKIGRFSNITRHLPRQVLSSCRERFAHSFRVYRYYWLLVPPFLVYVTWWSYFTIAKFYALNATVFDLGLEAQGIWWPLHPQGLSLSFYLLEATSRPDSVVLSPLSLSLSYPFILFFQSAALGLGAFAVFLIAKSVWGEPLPAYLLSLAYLLYFPMAGPNWFDFHIQALFIPGFLFGYAALLQGHRRLSFTLFFLAGATTYGYMILIIGFAALSLSEYLLKSAWSGARTPRHEWVFMSGLLIASILFYVYQSVYFTSYLGGSSYVLGSAGFVSATGGFPLANRLSVLLLVLAPVLFLVLFSPKWLAMLGPFVILELGSSATFLSYPAVLHSQYTTMVIPPVFIGAVYGGRRLVIIFKKFKNQSRGPGTTGGRRFRLDSRDDLTVYHLAGSALTVTLVLAVLYQPYGPLNSSIPDNFEVEQATSINWSTYNELDALSSLIPSTTPYVLFQNNMPMMLPRPLDYHETALTMSFIDWLNATDYDARVNQFPLLLDGTVYQVPLLYALADPFSIWYTVGASSPNTTMGNFTQSMIQSGAYGILGEAGGMFALERGYTGPLVYYEPYWTNYLAQQFYSGQTDQPSESSIISRSDVSDQSVWYGPYAYLSPGLYRITYSVESTSLSPSNRIDLYVTANSFHTVLGRMTVTGSEFQGIDVWTNFSQTVYLGSPLGQVEFPGDNAFWNGSIAFRGVTVSQIGQPNPIYTE